MVARGSKAPAGDHPITSWSHPADSWHDPVCQSRRCDSIAPAGCLRSATGGLSYGRLGAAGRRRGDSHCRM